MPRSKVKLEYITDEYARKTSFMKRKTSVMKKLNELCTLCGVDACAIMYSEYDPEVEVWPSNVGAQFVLDQFMMMPEVEQSKKMVNQDSYIRKRISKAKEQLDKHMKENREKKIGIVISECLSGEASVVSLTLMDLKDMVFLIDHYVSEIDARLEFLKGGGPPPPPQLVQPQANVGGSSTDNHMVEGGVPADGYVPVVENAGALDGIIPNTEWFTDWVDGLGFGQGDHMTSNSPAADPNPPWSSPSSKTS
ncbi:agamous-like MADS-box protein AGL80 [Cynara cardunculus var. scolymus]|uniref:MADS-box domain-containing protein n=1 Tax=Cynara cardunculus var. scolymus TaxID=59895 RepID=A0A103XS89_CYNCS|nr:agamous-like MADS-box protein AGL80 [Cynara cardunculus var. scolymus]KVH95948.1 hypothetical protein Ccrd_001970 [Cynara cardunculus var. scolymus]